MKQSGLYDGRRLILGPNCPFKNIPILGMILWYYFPKTNLYTIKMEIDEADGTDGHIQIKKNDDNKHFLKKLMTYRKY